jgi:hypothetical protein
MSLHTLTHAVALTLQYTASSDALVGKKFHIWLGTEDDVSKDQFYTTATVTNVEGQKCQILLSDMYGQDNFAEQQEWLYEATRKAVELFNSGKIKNPEPPTAPPQMFEMMRAAVHSEYTHKFASSPLFKLLAFKRVWCNPLAADGQMKYLWQNVEKGFWCLGTSTDEICFFTVEAAANAHEDHSWQYIHDGRHVDVEICFKAHISKPPPLQHQRFSGAGGSLGAAGGSSASSAAAGSSAAPAAAGSSATSDVAPTPRSSTGGAGGGPPAADPQDADRLEKGDPLCISFDPNDQKEGYFHATVVSVCDDEVTYGTNINTGGVFNCFLDANGVGKLGHSEAILNGVGKLSYSEALLFHMDFVNNRNIPHPHPGSFGSFEITHATRGAFQIVGTYELTDMKTLWSLKPIYRKKIKASNQVEFMWPSKQDKWVFGNFSQMNEKGGTLGYAVAQHSSLWPHYTRDFVIEGHPARIFSYATKQQPVVIPQQQPPVAAPQPEAIPPQQPPVAPPQPYPRPQPQPSPRAALEVGQSIFAFYPLNGTKAGFACAEITKIDNDGVTYKYTNNSKLEKQSLTVKYNQAEIGRTAYLAQSTAPDPPYTGSFKSVTIFACKDDKDLEGKYLATTNPKKFSNGKPIFLKENAIPGYITAMWHTDEKKWVITCCRDTNSTLSLTDYTRHPVYATTATAAEWPYRTHDYILREGFENVKVYSYCTKDSVIEVLTSSESENSSEDVSSDEGGDAAGAADKELDATGDAGEGGARPKRAPKPRARDKVDPSNVAHFAARRSRVEKKRKSEAEKNRDRTKSSKTGGGADGPAAGAMR